MKKISLLNETNRMKEIMGVPLTEAVIQIEPSEDPKREDAVKINAFGVFPVNVTKNDTSDKFIAELVNKIKGDENLTEKLANGELKVKSMRLRGGASNWNNTNGAPGMGIVEPEVANSESLLTSFDVPEFTDKSRYKDSKFDGNLKHNTKLAKTRAANLWKQLASKLPKAGISVEGVSPEITGYNVDTGGKVDRKRNKEIYKVPGQHVFVEILMDQPAPEEDKLIQCLTGVKVVVGYFKRATTIEGVKFPPNRNQNHTCNYATFTIYLNDVPVGNVNMNNNVNNVGRYTPPNEYQEPSSNIGKNEENNEYVTDNRQGGQVYNILTITPEKARSILGDGVSTIQMSMKPNSNSTLRGENKDQAHGDAPMVGVFKITEDDIILKYPPREPYASRNNRLSDVKTSDKVKLGAPFEACEGETVVPTT